MCTGAEPAVAADAVGKTAAADAALGAGEAAGLGGSAGIGGGAAGAGAGAAGASALGAGAMEGGGFIGEGIASGVPAWDSAATAAGLGLTAPAAAGALSTSTLPQTATAPFGGAPGGAPGAASATPTAGLPSAVAPGGAAPLDMAELGGSGSGGGASAPTFTGAPGATAGAATPAPATATPPVVAPPAGTAAEPSLIQKALDTIGNNKLNTANLGLAGLSMYRQKQMADSAQSQLNKIAAPTTAVEQQLLDQFQKGQITGADQFAITQFAQKQKAAVDAYYAKAGLSKSSMHLAALREVDTQAEGMRQQALQNMLSGGLRAAGVSSPTLTAGVTAGMQSDAAAMKAMQDYLAMMARINTPQASTQPAPTGSP